MALFAFLFALLLFFPRVSCAQAVFGKNKVQYSDFDWFQTHGRYVTVYFYSEEREIAGQALALAEAACAMLSESLHHEPAKRIPLALYSSPVDFQQSNIVPFLLPEEVAGLTEFARGRIMVPYTGSFFRFKWVLLHELTHAFMMDKIDAVLRAKGRPLNYYPPLWFSEGLAEYMSAEQTPRM
ncbi:MAG: hypothetical protein V2A71_05175, partial [Candidatus Eisenbacteria bacterium]